MVTDAKHKVYGQAKKLLGELFFKLSEIVTNYYKCTYKQIAGLLR